MSHPESHSSPTPAAAETPSIVTEQVESADQASAAATAEASATTTAEVDVAALQARIVSLEQQTSEHYDAFLRARAETENIRRRAANEASNASKYAIESFAEALLAVADSLEAAMNDQSGSAETLRSGVEITLRQLLQALEKNKVLPMAPVGEKFDPNQHMAVQMVPGGEQQPPVAANHVVRVLQKGYRIHERTLRPAMVVVAQ